MLHPNHLLAVCVCWHVIVPQRGGGGNILLVPNDSHPPSPTFSLKKKRVTSHNFFVFLCECAVAQKEGLSMAAQSVKAVRSPQEGCSDGEHDGAKGGAGGDAADRGFVIVCHGGLLEDLDRGHLGEALHLCLWTGALCSPPSSCEI